MADIATYDPQAFTVIFGPIIFTGFSEGTFVSVKENKERFTLHKGAMGHAVRSKVHDRSATITLTLMQSSHDNTKLTAIAQGDWRTPNGDGVLPFTIKRADGLLEAFAQHAWVREVPALELGVEQTDREWVLETDHIELGHAGIGEL